MLALAGALTATAFGQLTYKLYFRTGKAGCVAAAILFFLLVPVCSYVALRAIPIGIFYMSTAMTHLLVMALSRVVLKEKLTTDHAVAMVLIISGVVLYAAPM